MTSAGIEGRQAQTLVVSTPTPDVVLKCDSDRILQVLSNLLGNALKFTPDRGRIELRAALARDHVRFSVADSGPGLPDEMLERVFDRFYRHDPLDNHGTGLGLAICRAIAARSMATLTLANRGDHTGLVATTTLRRTPTDPARAETDGEDPPGAHG